MGNGIFWSETGSGFGDAGGTPPPKIPRGTPRGLKYRAPLEVLYFNLDSNDINSVFDVFRTSLFVVNHPLTLAIHQERTGYRHLPPAFICFAYIERWLGIN